MICGSISDSGTHPKSVHGIYQGYADNTGGSFNSSHDPSDITGFINTICNDIESLYPWEKDVYIKYLTNYLEKQRLEAAQDANAGF